MQCAWGYMIDENNSNIFDYWGLLEALNKSQAVVEFDRDGDILNVNENFLTLSGYKREEIKGRHHSIFVTEKDKDSESYKEFWDDLRKGVFQSGEFKCLSKSGNEIWLQATYNPIYDKNNEVVKVVKLATDISARKKVYHKHLQDLKRLDIATEAGEVGLWDWDLRTDEVNFSKIWMGLLGYEHYELPHKERTFESLIHPDDKEGCFIALESHLKNHDIPFNKEIRMRHKKGYWVWIQTAGRVVESDAEGKPIRMCGAHLDISFKKQTEESLRAEVDITTKKLSENENLLDTIINTLPSAVYVKDVNDQFRYLLANKAAYELSSMDRSAIGANDYELFPKDIADTVRERDKKIIQEKSPLEFSHVSTLHHNETVYLNTSLTPILNEQGEAQFIVGLTSDITRIAKREKELEQLSKVKDEFLANMSHELRTPLNSILGLSKLLLAEDLPKEVSDSVIVIDQASESLLNTVNDILNLSKITSEAFKLENVPFVPCNIVIKQVNIIKPLAEAKNLEFKTSNLTDNHVVYGDPLRFEIIIRNLLSNAVKYTEEGRILCNYKLNKKKDSYSFEFTVSDTGIGMSEKVLERIFDKFTQADLTTQRKYGGSGLGLNLTKTIVDLHGGRIDVKSELGKGTTFTVHINFQAANQEKEKYAYEHTHYAVNPDFSTEEEKDLKNIENAKVLVAEDHAFNCLLIEKLLKRLGISKYDIAHDGKEVLKLYENEEYDVIFMDCHMPKMDGFEATRKVMATQKYKESPIPIIALTADAMVGTKEKCFAIGMAAYLNKPIDEEGLHKVLKNWFFLNEGKVKPPYTLTSTRHVDLQTLHDYTDGRRDEILELLDFFIDAAEETLKGLDREKRKKKNKKWTELSHKLKGSAAYIGANELKTLCEQAQSMTGASIPEKKMMIEKIYKEYDAVKSDLKKM